MKSKKICCLTGSRAEYGILKPLLKKLYNSDDFVMNLVATGSHLSESYGYTINDIKQDFEVDKEIPILKEDDSQLSKILEMSKAQENFSKHLIKAQPDIVILVGDRYEILPMAIAAYMLKIPVAHIHGGEVTEGSLDNGIRHAITQLSSIHFASTDEYKNRIINMGAKPSVVTNVGALGVERVKEYKLSSRESVEEKINFRFGEKNIIFTFHPPTNEDLDFKFLFENFIKILDAREGMNVIFTGANADSGGLEINEIIKNYVKSNSENSCFFMSLGEGLFIDVLNQVDLIFGNSSSAFLEAPALNLPAINVGERQNGRVVPDNIINCNADYQSISKAISEVYSDSFKEKISELSNPYGDGNSSERIVSILKNIKLDNLGN
mgnify:FL=1